MKKFFWYVDHHKEVNLLWRTFPLPKIVYFTIFHVVLMKFYLQSDNYMEYMHISVQSKITITIFFNLCLHISYKWFNSPWWLFVNWNTCTLSMQMTIMKKFPKISCLLNFLWPNEGHDKINLFILINQGKWININVRPSSTAYNVC